MNDLLKKLQKIKIGKKNTVLIVGAVLLSLFLLGSELLGGEKSEPISKEDTSRYSAQYIEKTEKNLESLLEKISGAGEVRVMITLENCYENVFAKGYNEKQNSEENSEKYESEEEYIIVKNGSNNSESNP